MSKVESKIIPLYLYNQNGRSKFSYAPISDSASLASIFYVIDPEITPLPYGTELFCVEQDDFVRDVSEMYDPFNRDRKCLRFLGWNDPAPYTTPVFLYKKLDGVFISETPLVGEEELVFSPIHLLKLRSNGSLRDLKKPLGFSNYIGRCLPDPNGTSIEECLKINTTKNQPLFLSNIPKQFSLETVFVFLFLIILPVILVWKKRN